jgi:hypothetical protein
VIENGKLTKDQLARARETISELGGLIIQTFDIYDRHYNIVGKREGALLARSHQIRMERLRGDMLSGHDFLQEAEAAIADCRQFLFLLGQ